MSDILSELDAVHRQVGATGNDRTVLLRRGYDAEIEDVWDAVTDPDRIARWFLPVSGELRLGGRYQLEGNAGGEILRCEPPRLLAVTWVFGESTSTVEVRLTEDPARGTELVLEHTLAADAHWAEYGPGAVGVGWDLTLLGLGMHLAGGEMSAEERAAWPRTEEAREFMTRSAQAWGAAHEASGEPSDQAGTAAQKTAAAYGA
jgi:uncharacterized protein YndB with AHSA1/START domain